MNEISSFISDNLNFIYLLMFASFLGLELISKVSSILHTPLMSGSNAISGIIIIGAIILLRKSPSDDYFSLVVGSLGILLGTINVVGGFAVTHRMLNMFNKK